MQLADHTLRTLRPLLDELENPTEAPSDYVARVQSVLPNFPGEVIIQWFYDHRQVIDESRWLGFSTLEFSLVSLSNEQLGLSCLAEHETVVQYRDYFIAGVESPRMNRISSYVAQHGTWPVAPILLRNPRNDVVSPWGLRYSQPYDVIEGHHRLAVYYAFTARNLVNSSHKAWLLIKGDA